MPKEADDVMKKQDELLSEREFKKKEAKQKRIAEEEWKDALKGALSRSAKPHDED